MSVCREVMDFQGKGSVVTGCALLGGCSVVYREAKGDL